MTLECTVVQSNAEILHPLVRSSNVAEESGITWMSPARRLEKEAGSRWVKLHSRLLEISRVCWLCLDGILRREGHQVAYETQRDHKHAQFPYCTLVQECIRASLWGKWLKEAVVKFTNRGHSMICLRKEFLTFGCCPIWCCWIVLFRLGRCDAWCTTSIPKELNSHEHLSPGVSPFGLNGAAFAAFGDIPALLKPGPGPLLASVEGVKLGESTVRRFFKLFHQDTSKLELTIFKIRV